MTSLLSKSIMNKPIILGIAGGTGAGKVQSVKSFLFASENNVIFLTLLAIFPQTTLAKAVFKAIGGGENAVYLTHDHYYKDISHLTLEERSKTNFDHPDSLDTDLLVQHIRELKAGRTANLPNYDFTTHSRTPVTTLVQPKRIIIVEGILIFTNHDLCEEMDMKVFVVRFLVLFDWVKYQRKINLLEYF